MTQGKSASAQEMLKRARDALPPDRRGKWIYWEPILEKQVAFGDAAAAQQTVEQAATEEDRQRLSKILRTLGEQPQAIMALKNVNALCVKNGAGRYLGVATQGIKIAPRTTEYGEEIKYTSELRMSEFFCRNAKADEIQCRSKNEPRSRSGLASDERAEGTVGLG
jgi:hypothetical protein